MASLFLGDNHLMPEIVKFVYASITDLTCTVLAIYWWWQSFVVSVEKNPFSVFTLGCCHMCIHVCVCIRCTKIVFVCARICVYVHTYDYGYLLDYACLCIHMHVCVHRVCAYLWILVYVPALAHCIRVYGHVCTCGFVSVFVFCEIFFFIRLQTTIN